VIRLAHRRTGHRGVLAGRLAACVAACLAASVVVTISGSAARADTAGDAAQAQQQADAITAKIASLQPHVDQAMAAYETALDAVGQSVGTSVAASRVYQALQAQATAATMSQNAHIVALYESGSVTLYAAVLTTGNPNSVPPLPMLSGVVARDAATAAAANRVAAAAKRTADTAEYQISTTLTDAAEVDDHLSQLQNLLAQQQALLDQASAKAKQLKELQSAQAALAAALATISQAGNDAAASASPTAIPPRYDAFYHAASLTCPGLSWTVLAAIGQVETHHGQGTMVSSAGALGPMQFMPATFAHYAVDGDGDGKADIMNPADSIYTAAHYLCANGAGTGDQGLYNALWHYNHADWYVQLVLSLASKVS
jgi:uncharacterized protein YoxC